MGGCPSWGRLLAGLPAMPRTLNDAQCLQQLVLPLQRFLHKALELYLCIDALQAVPVPEKGTPHRHIQTMLCAKADCPTCDNGLVVCGAGIIQLDSLGDKVLHITTVKGHTHRHLQQRGGEAQQQEDTGCVSYCIIIQASVRLRGPALIAQLPCYWYC